MKRAALRRPFGAYEMLLALLGDASGLADAITEIVELGATHAAVTHDLDLGNRRGVDREDPFDSLYHR